MKKITQNIIRLFVISSLTCTFLGAAEEEKKKPAKKPTKTPEERFQWLDKDKDGGKFGKMDGGKGRRFQLGFFSSTEQ